MPPYVADGRTNVYAQFTILVENRNVVRERLDAAGIPTAVHYPVPLNRQPAFETDEFDLSFADELAGKVMSLPMHPYLAEQDQLRIVSELAQCT